jgi:hypothetical protein
MTGCESTPVQEALKFKNKASIRSMLANFFKKLQVLKYTLFI